MKKVVVMLLAILLVGMGCGSSGGDAKKKQQALAAANARKQAAKRAKQQAVHDKCEQDMGGFLDALGELDSRIKVGLNYSSYGNKLGDVRVAYDRVPYDELGASDLECLAAVGLPAENSFKQFAKAGDVWDTCFENIDCNNDSIDPELQAHWSKAGTFYRKAQRGLTKLQP